MALARRAGVAARWNRGTTGAAGQRVGGAAEHTRAIDPATERFQTWIIPAGGGVVRNMMPTRDGNLALAESGVNRVALVTIAALIERALVPCARAFPD